MAEDKNFNVEGRIRVLRQERTPTGIETTLGLETKDSRKYRTIVRFPSPTGLRIGDYVSTQIGRVDGSGEVDVHHASVVYHVKSRKDHRIIEEYRA